MQNAQLSLLSQLSLSSRGTSQPFAGSGPMSLESLLASGSGEALVSALLVWFERHQRPLPWRKNYRPYEVWISEVMLQQTQMERGVDYFLRWMERFPDVAAVTAASEDEILHAWEGLGYYRRARFLHAAAQAMLAEHGGLVPHDPAALAALPGLGPYTAAAIRGIAFNQDVPVVDANVERVFSRLLNLEQPPKHKEAARRIREAAAGLLPGGRAREYNQALMELGALLCKKTPQCEKCPVAGYCESRRLGLERQRPVPTAKPGVIAVQAVHGVLELEGGVLLHRRPPAGLWGNLWEFPGGDFSVEEDPAQALKRFFLAATGLDVCVGSKLGEVRHGYTNHRLTAHFYRVELPGGFYPSSERTAEPELAMPERVMTELAMAVPSPAESSRPELTRLASLDSLHTLAMPAHHRKMAEQLYSGLRETLPL